MQTELVKRGPEQRWEVRRSLQMHTNDGYFRLDWMDSEFLPKSEAFGLTARERGGDLCHALVLNDWVYESRGLW